MREANYTAVYNDTLPAAQRKLAPSYKEINE
jgi:hypothetical protein